MTCELCGKEATHTAVTVDNNNSTEHETAYRLKPLCYLHAMREDLYGGHTSRVTPITASK